MKIQPNASLINKIQPQGGVSFKHEKYISTGTGELACIRIYEYPSQVDDLWLIELLKENDCITTIDINTQDKIEALKNINKNIKEQEARYVSEKNKIEQKTALDEIGMMNNLVDEINNQGEIIKLTHMRIFVSADTKKELEKKIINLIKELEGKGFRGAIFLNESEFEFKSLFSNYNTMLEKDPSNDGLPIQSFVLASGFPFHFSQLKDDNGMNIGTTSTSGSVLFDQFHNNDDRMSYESVIIGVKGTGKSTLLKILLLHNVIKDNFTRVFDPSDEFITLVENLGGKIINLDGTGGMQNILEIVKTDENEEVSFAKHFNKVRTFYSIISDTTEQDKLSEFESMVKKLYDKFNISLENKGIVTGLSVKQYPILSDLLELVQQELYQDKHKKEIKKELSEYRSRILEEIDINLTNIIQNYGHMFNGQSTIENFIDEKLVLFNIKSLKNFSENIFNAQLFNILNLLWDNLIRLGSRMKELYENGQISFEDVERFLISVDEAHLLINTKNPLILKFFTDFARQSRKYFGGFILAYHNILDMFPEGGSDKEEDEIKKLFSLIQYKFLMRQDSSSTSSLLKVFENELTYNEAKMITKFSRGDCILVGTGSSNIHFGVDVSDEELELFKGGV